MRSLRILPLIVALVLGLPAVGAAQGWGYAWANNPTSASYTPSAIYSHNSAGGAITATRSGTGTYAIRFAGLGSGATTAGGTVQVTGYGRGREWCKILSWGSNGADFHVNVRCFTPTGNPADTPYSIMVSWPDLQPKKRGYAWTNNPSSASYTPSPTYSYNSAGGAITATRSGTGVYAIRFAGLGGGGGAGGNVQVTAYGGSSRWCKVVSWSSGGTDFIVNVQCFGPDHQLADSQYSIQVTW